MNTHKTSFQNTTSWLLTRRCPSVNCVKLYKFKLEASGMFYRSLLTHVPSSCKNLQTALWRRSLRLEQCLPPLLALRTGTLESFTHHSRSPIIKRNLPGGICSLHRVLGVQKNRILPHQPTRHASLNTVQQTQLWWRPICTQNQTESAVLVSLAATFMILMAPIPSSQWGFPELEKWSFHIVDNLAVWQEYGT